MNYVVRDEILEQFANASRTAWLIFDEDKLSGDEADTLEEMVDSGWVLHRGGGYQLSSAGRREWRAIQEYKEDNELDPNALLIEKVAIAVYEDRIATNINVFDFAERVGLEPTQVTHVFDRLCAHDPNLGVVTRDGYIGSGAKYTEIYFEQGVRAMGREFARGLTWTEWRARAGQMIQAVGEYVAGDKVSGDKIGRDQIGGDQIGGDKSTTTVHGGAGVTVVAQEGSTVTVGSQETADDIKELSKKLDQLLDIFENRFEDLSGHQEDVIEHILGNQDLARTILVHMRDAHDVVMDAVMSNQATMEDVQVMLDPIWSSHMTLLTKPQVKAWLEKEAPYLVKKAAGAALGAIRE